jgi:hypothetical protein
MFAVPKEVGVAMPVPAFTVKIDVLLELHVPLPGASE